MEQFTELKRLKDSYSSMRWTASLPDVRLFNTDRERTQEFTVGKRDLEIFSEALGVTENEGGSGISFCASYELGNAVKQLVFRCIEKKLAKLSVAAIAEAQAVLDHFSKQTSTKPEP